MHLNPSHLPILPPEYPAAAHQLSVIVTTRTHSPALPQLAQGSGVVLLLHALGPALLYSNHQGQFNCFT